MNKDMEYELLDISFSASYETIADSYSWKVCEDIQVVTDKEEEQPTIEYDSEGIPLGRSRREIKIREKAIKEFYAKWISENPEKKIWNKNLRNYIFVKFISINETYEKASRTYESTKAVFNLSEILENAQLVSEQPSKTNNKNQKSFSKILIMKYERVKLTVGYQKNTQDNVQYSITVPQKQKSHPER